MKKVRIGIIGTGVGIRTLLPGFRNIDEAEVISLLGSSPEKSEYFANRFEIPQVYNTVEQLCESDDIDLICVATPNNCHYEQAKKAIIHGKHVLCEKPLACTWQQTIELVKLSRQTEKLCLLDHQLRFNPYIKKIKEIIVNNELGKLYFLRIHQQSMGFSDPDAKWSWSFDDKQNGGVRWAMGVHFADLLLYWLKEDMFNISGNMSPVIEWRKDSENVERKINSATLCTASMLSQSGIDIELSVTAAAFSEPRFDVDLYGTKGELHFDLKNKIHVYYPDKEQNKSWINLDGVSENEIENKVSFFSGSFQYFAPLIIKAITEHSFDYVKEAAVFEDAIYTYKLLQSIQESTNTNSFINKLKYTRHYT